MPDAYGQMPMPALAVFSAVLSKVAAYGFLRVAHPAVPGRREGLPADDHDPRGRRHPLRLGDGLHADEPAADPRLLVAGPAVVHHARDLLPRPSRARRARSCSRSTTASWCCRSSSSCCSPPSAPAARRTSASSAAWPFRGPVIATLALIVALRDAGDPRLGELRRRVLHPARRLQREARARDHRLHRRRAGVRLRAARLHPHVPQPRAARGRRGGDGRLLARPARARAARASRSSPSASTRRRRCDAGEQAVGSRNPESRGDQVNAAPSKAPDIDFAAISPLIALAAGAVVVLMIGLMRGRASCARARRARAHRRHARRRDRARRLAVGHEHARHRRRACDRRADARR